MKNSQFPFGSDRPLFRGEDPVQCDVGGLRHDEGNRGHRLGKSPAIVTFLEPGNRIPIEDFAGEAVREDSLHAVARFDSGLPLFHGKKDQHPFVFALLSNSPCLVKAICIVARRVVSDRLYRCDDDCGAGFFQNFPGKVLHPAFILGGDYSGEVIDRTCRFWEYLGCRRWENGEGKQGRCER